MRVFVTLEPNSESRSGTGLAKVPPGRDRPPIAAGGAPMLRIGHVEVGCGGLVDVLRLTALSPTILATSALVTWTTDIADVARRLPHGVAGRGQGDAPSRIGRSRSHRPWEPCPC